MAESVERRPAVATSHHFPCATCGSDMRFSAASGAMECGHCGVSTSLPAERATVSKRPLADGFDLSRLPLAAMEEVRLAHCPDCGADVEFADGLHSTDCPFCTTPVVVDTGPSRRIKPQALIPFAIPERTARDAIRAWLESQDFAPDALPAEARQNDPLKSVYVPTWTFDVDADARYAGKATFKKPGDDLGSRRETSGRIRTRLEDVHIIASNGLSGPSANRLNPWDLSALRPYDPVYLSGHRAEAYAFDLEEGIRRGTKRMETLLKRHMLEDMGGTYARVTETHIEYDAPTYAALLLPVWIYTYRFKGKVYRVLVNGQSGEVRGEYPVSGWKVAGHVARLVLLLGGFFFLFVLLTAISNS